MSWMNSSCRLLLKWFWVFSILNKKNRNNSMDFSRRRWWLQIFENYYLIPWLRAITSWHPKTKNFVFLYRNPVDSRFHAVIDSDTNTHARHSWQIAYEIGNNIDHLPIGIWIRSHGSPRCEFMEIFEWKKMKHIDVRWWRSHYNRYYSLLSSSRAQLQSQQQPSTNTLIRF